MRHGIPETDTQRVLASDDYADAVRADQAKARALGITGVPFAVFDGRVAVAGARSVDGYADVLAGLNTPGATCRLDGTCD